MIQVPHSRQGIDERSGPSGQAGRRARPGQARCQMGGGGRRGGVVPSGTENQTHLMRYGAAGRSILPSPHPALEAKADAREQGLFAIVSLSSDWS